VSIEKEFDSSLPTISGDQIQLQQVVLNLVLNAAEAMNEASPDLRRLIIRTLRHDDRFAEVSIRDCGPGIKDNPVGKIFEPFYTTKSDGMGMGLAISKEIVNSHKGVIWGENNTDRGATFYFTVPFDRGVSP
jgi:signal transduction histidine kinase